MFCHDYIQAMDFWQKYYRSDVFFSVGPIISQVNFNHLVVSAKFLHFVISKYHVWWYFETLQNKYPVTYQTFTPLPSILSQLLLTEYL